MDSLGRSVDKDGYLTKGGKRVSRRPVVVVNPGKSLTKQSFAKELDVNRIVKKYQQTGVLQKAHDFEAVYGQFDSLDLRDYIEKVDAARDLFQEVPSDIRAKFNNDPGLFIDYATDEANMKQMVDWGLAEMPESQVYSELPESKTVDQQAAEPQNKEVS